MKKLSKYFTIALVSFMLVGCMSHSHVVGTGGSGTSTEEARQWYVLFGLVPINDVDTKQLAGGSANYTVKTQQSFLDVVINIFTGAVTVYSRTVTVTK